MHCTDFSERCQTSFVISCLSNTTSLLIRVMWFCFLLLGFIFFGGGGGCFVVGGRICFFVFFRRDEGISFNSAFIKGDGGGDVIFVDFKSRIVKRLSA